MLPPEAMGSQFRGAAPVILFGILVLATIGGVFFLLC
jgi:hypothetical protein